MAEPFLGQVIAVGFNFVPQGWLPCNGTTVPISENQALFALLGTIYGGDGVSTFGLPDLRGRVAVNAGHGTGLSAYAQGQSGGAESVTLSAAQAASHSHGFMASALVPGESTPSANLVLGQSTQSSVSLLAAPPANTNLAALAIVASAGGQPHENRQPFLAINYIICAAGVFPSQG